MIILKTDNVLSLSPEDTFFLIFIGSFLGINEIFVQSLPLMVLIVVNLGSILILINDTKARAPQRDFKEPKYVIKLLFAAMLLMGVVGLALGLESADLGEHIWAYLSLCLVWILGSLRRFWYRALKLLTQDTNLRHRMLTVKRHSYGSRTRQASGINTKESKDHQLSEES